MIIRQMFDNNLDKGKYGQANVLDCGIWSQDLANKTLACLTV